MANYQSRVSPVWAESAYTSIFQRHCDNFVHPLSFRWGNALRLPKSLANFHHAICVGLFIYALNPLLIIAISCYSATIGLVAIALLTNRKRDVQFSDKQPIASR
jgi:hypothetical protein